MSHTTYSLHGFIAPEKRITKEITAKLEALAPLLLIQVRHIGRQKVELSGAGFSGQVPVVLPPAIAKVRLLAEICSILARWVPFNLWEPCEVTLFSMPESRIERCALNWRKQMNQQVKAAARANAALGLQG